MTHPEVVRVEAGGHKFVISNTPPYFCVSDLRDTDGDGEENNDFDDDEQKFRFLGAVDAIEATVLAHYRAGVDVTDEAYRLGLQIVIEALMNEVL